MRLWHEALLPKLPRQQLLGQHREVAALRGAGWERNMRQSITFLLILHISCTNTISLSWQRCSVAAIVQQQRG